MLHLRESGRWLCKSALRQRQSRKDSFAVGCFTSAQAKKKQGDALQAFLSTPLAHILRPGLPATKSIQEGWQYLKYRVCVYMRLHVRLRVCKPKLVEFIFEFKKISSVAVRLRHQKSGGNKNL